MKEPGKILVALGDRSLGEAARVLPICHAIKTHWPDSHLSVGCARDTQRALLETYPQISQLVEERNLKVTGLKHLWRTIKYFVPVARAMSGYDAILLLHRKNSRWPMFLLAQLSGAQVYDKRNLRYYREEYESRHREAEKAGIILTGKISVGQLIAMISKCDMLWGEPSGPSWVAAALGKPTVTIVPYVDCSLASWLPVIKTEAGFRNAKHTIIVYEDGKPVTEYAVARILLERLQARPGRHTSDTSDLELSKQTTVVLDGVEAAEMGRNA